MSNVRGYVSDELTMLQISLCSHATLSRDRWLAKRVRPRTRKGKKGGSRAHARRIERDEGQRGEDEDADSRIR